MPDSRHSSEGTTEVEHIPQADMKIDPNPEATIPEDPESKLEHDFQSLISPAVTTPGTPPTSILVARKPTVAHRDTRDAARSEKQGSGGGKKGGISKWLRLRRAASSMMIPERRVGDAPGVMKSLWAVVRASRMHPFLYEKVYWR